MWYERQTGSYGCPHGLDYGGEMPEDIKNESRESRGLERDHALCILIIESGTSNFECALKRLFEGTYR
jgi:hypothetical protein